MQLVLNLNCMRIRLEYEPEQSTLANALAVFIHEANGMGNAEQILSQITQYLQEKKLDMQDGWMVLENPLNNVDQFLSQEENQSEVHVQNLESVQEEVQQDENQLDEGGNSIENEVAQSPPEDNLNFLGQTPQIPNSTSNNSLDALHVDDSNFPPSQIQNQGKNSSQNFSPRIITVSKNNKTRKQSHTHEYLQSNITDNTNINTNRRQHGMGSFQPQLMQKQQDQIHYLQHQLQVQNQNYEKLQLQQLQLQQLVESQLQQSQLMQQQLQQQFLQNQNYEKLQLQQVQLQQLVKSQLQQSQLIQQSQLQQSQLIQQQLQQGQKYPRLIKMKRNLDK